MICKYCNQHVPDGSIFCMMCGERLARKRAEKKAAGPKYPKYRTLADGSLLGQLMVDGRRETIKARSEAEYRAKCDAYRTHILDMKEHPERRALKTVLREYIDKNDGVLSPATIRGYEYIYKGRFADYMGQEIGKIDYQKMVNDEAKKAAPKTVCNGWALVTAAFRDAKIPVPEINLPTVPESDEDFLDYEQIQTFLAAVRGNPVELAALLMLHSLRVSEVLALDVQDVTGEIIRVRGAVVPNKNNKFVEKATNKNRTSTRDVPVMIDRLTDLLPESGRAVTLHPSSIRRRLESERAIMAVGGWNNIETVHRIYVKLSKKDVSADVAKMKNYYGFTTETKKAAD